jgi:hypothetical protein
VRQAADGDHNAGEAGQGRETIPKPVNHPHSSSWRSLGSEPRSIGGRLPVLCPGKGSSLVRPSHEKRPDGSTPID